MTPTEYLPDDVLEPGTVIHDGRYRIETVLGRGGFGVTYRAHDLRLDRTVAVKEHFPEGSTRVGDSVRWTHRATTSGGAAEGVRRFLEEARTLARIGANGHSGIVTVHDAFEERNTAYMVMDFLHGRTLDEVVATSGPIAAERVQAIGISLCEALAVVHGHKANAADGNAVGVFLHQDISPSNVFLVPAAGGTGERAVLIDFGAARTHLADQSHDASRIVKVGYSPMEFYSAKSERGPGSDLYALGATLYFALAAKAPLDALARLSGAALEPLKSIAPRTPDALVTAIEWTLALQLRDRPTSAQALALQIRGIAPPPPPPPPPPGHSSDTGSQEPMRRDLTVRLDEPNTHIAQPLPPPNTQDKKKQPLAILALLAVVAALLGVVVTLLLSGKSDTTVVAVTSAPAEASGAPSVSETPVSVETNPPVQTAAPVTQPPDTAPPVTAARTEPPPSNDRSVFDLPRGLFCRDLNSMGFSFNEARQYWVHWGQPAQMDIDLNGIPCETVYPRPEIDASYAGSGD